MDWRDFPSLSALRAFDATARHGGFSAAASALNVTHAAVVQQVRGLERFLDVRLAVRQGRGIRLTPEGERLAAALDDGFGGIAETLKAMTRAGDKKSLRVTTTQFLVDEIILPNLPEFWREHPGIEISFYPSRLPVDVVEHGFDFGIQYELSEYPLGSPRVEVRRIADATMLAVGAPSLIEEWGEDVYALPWIRHDEMEPKLAIMRSVGLDLDRLKWVDVGSPSLLPTAVRKGLGMSMYNEVIARADLDRGVLRVVPTPRKGLAHYCAVFPKGPRPRIADTFVDWVAALL